MEEIATRTTWKTEPIDNPKRIDISLRFTYEQVAKLMNGLIPQAMEDKWFIFYECGWLYFHRSWTGYGIYKAHLVKKQDGYSIKEFWAERNQTKYQNDDDNTDVEALEFLIAQGLLGIDVREIYASKNLKSEDDYLKGWGMFGQLLYPTKDLSNTNKIKAVLFGVAVGDALGVPFEFSSRSLLKRQPLEEMVGYGRYNVPPGTFSDDASLTFCLAEALTNGYDLNEIGQNFVKWRNKNFWTARGHVFDIGNVTSTAILRLSKGEKVELAGNTDDSSNGNGSLMRISPLLFYLLDKPINERYEITKQVSSITHRHIRSVIACFYYLEFARQLYEAKDKFEVYKNLRTEISSLLTSLSVDPTEVTLFDRLLKNNIYELDEDHIHSSGYVLHTLEASIWCLLTTTNYKEAVLKAVNLGEDTDTTGAVTGGLAGLLYGYDNIPTEWINQIARQDDIKNLAERLGEKLRNR